MKDEAAGCIIEVTVLATVLFVLSLVGSLCGVEQLQIVAVISAALMIGGALLMTASMLSR